MVTNLKAGLYYVAIEAMFHKNSSYCRQYKLTSPVPLEKKGNKADLVIKAYLSRAMQLQDQLKVKKYPIPNAIRLIDDNAT